jgi:uncharacterized membrane protein YGL010W
MGRGATNLEFGNDVHHLVTGLRSPLLVLHDLFELPSRNQLHEEPWHTDGRVASAAPGTDRGSHDGRVAENPGLGCDLRHELTAFLTSPPRLVVRIGNFLGEKGDLDQVRFSADVDASEDTARSKLVVSDELARFFDEVTDVTLKGVPVSEDISLDTLGSPISVSMRNQHERRRNLLFCSVNIPLETVKGSSRHLVVIRDTVTKEVGVVGIAKVDLVLIRLAVFLIALAVLLVLAVVLLVLAVFLLVLAVVLRVQVVLIDVGVVLAVVLVGIAEVVGFGRRRRRTVVEGTARTR